MDRRTGGFVSLGCGGLLALVALSLTLFFGFHAFVDGGGAISDDEGAMGLVAGLCLLVPSLGLLAGGGFMAFRSPDGAGTTAPAAAGPSQVPAIGAGCFSLFMLVTTCLATGGIPYFSSEVSRWQAMRDEDVRIGADPLIVMIDDGAIRENEQAMYGSVGCMVCSGAIFLLGLGGTIALVMRSRRGAAT